MPACRQFTQKVQAYLVPKRKQGMSKCRLQLTLGRALRVKIYGTFTENHAVMCKYLAYLFESKI